MNAPSFSLLLLFSWFLLNFASAQTCSFEYAYPGDDTTNTSVAEHHFVGIYQPSGGYGENVAVNIDRPNKEVYLTLTSGLAASWVINLAAKTNLVRVRMNSGANSAILVTGGQVPPGELQSVNVPYTYYVDINSLDIIDRFNTYQGVPLNSFTGYYVAPSSPISICNISLPCVATDYYVRMKYQNSSTPSFSFYPIDNVNKIKLTAISGEYWTCNYTKIEYFTPKNDSWIVVKEDTNTKPTNPTGNEWSYFIDITPNLISGFRWNLTQCKNVPSLTVWFMKDIKSNCSNAVYTTAPYIPPPVTTAVQTTGVIGTTFNITTGLPFTTATTMEGTTTGITTGAMGTTTKQSSTTSQESRPGNVVNGPSNTDNITRNITIGVVVGGVCLIVLVMIILFVVLKRRKRERKDIINGPSNVELSNIVGTENHTYAAISPNSSAVPLNRFSINTTGSKHLEIDYKELTIIKECGNGSFGVVYQASWRGSNVAVKKLSHKLAGQAQVDEFTREIELMKHLRPHGNVLHCYGFCATPLCVVVEFCDGGSLYSLVMNSGAFEERRMLVMVAGIASGMMHLHKEGVIHRDLATRNILVNRNGDVKISDFGMSRMEEPSGGVTKSMVGPVRWMSPESLVNSEYSTKSDIWSFGVLLYEIMSKKVPYEDLEMMQVGIQVANGQVFLQTYLKEDAPNYHLFLVTLMNECLNRDSQARPEFSEIHRRVMLELEQTK